MTCKARQYRDQMVCRDCNLEWDTNDPPPPPCSTPVGGKPPGTRPQRGGFMRRNKRKTNLQTSR